MIANHHSHSELKRKNNRYGEAIIQSKRQHWIDYLEEMTSSDIWMANKFIKEPTGNGSYSKIPTLKTRDIRGNDILVNDNKEKAKLFAKTFFLDTPNTSIDYNQFNYPKPLPNPLQLNQTQLTWHIAKLSPYKAHRPDRIPDIVLQKCVDLIVD